MNRRTLNSQITLTTGQRLECGHDLSRAFDLQGHSGLVNIQVDGAASAEPAKGDNEVTGIRIEAEVALPGTYFQRAVLPGPEGVCWQRTAIARPGYFIFVFDRIEAGEAATVSSVEELWEGAPPFWRAEQFETQPAESGAACLIRAFLTSRLEDERLMVDLADERLVRLKKMRAGTLAGLGDSSSAMSVRNIELVAEGFLLHESGFSVLNALHLSYSGRPILESDKPISMELEFVYGRGVLEGPGDAQVVLHGGNMPHEIDLSTGWTEIEITGLSRKSDWWNVVMAAVQRL